MDKEKLLMGVVVDKWDGETIGEGIVNVKIKKIDYKSLLEGCAVEVEEFLNSRREEMLDYRRANLTLNSIGAEGGVMAVTELARVLNKYYFACLDDDVWAEEMDDQKK